MELLINELKFVLGLTIFSVVLATLLTPIYTYFAYKYKFWKTQRTNSVTGEKLKVFDKLHKKKISRNIPTMAGIIMVFTVTIITLMLNLTRGGTYLPLAALIGGAIVGLIDDILNVFGKNKKVAGMRAGVKFGMILTLGLVLGWYFYYKLGHDSINFPFIGDLKIGLFVIPIFAFAVLATGNAVNISDGLDGLAGGLAILSFITYGSIALLQGYTSMAGFCFTVAGALMSYLWFNVYPARFFMGDVGSFALGSSLGVVAMLTDAFLLLPIVGFMFVVIAGSSLIQIISKKFFHKKVFISAPIHHHLEATGWPEVKITMRFWLIALITGILGILLAINGGSV